MDNSIKISIITVAYNAQKYIEETLVSIKNQTYSNIEYIVIDGKSTDNTPKIIEKYKNIISKHICETDDSMYDAINKGLCISTGDFALILNSDDYLYSSDAIENVVSFIKNNQGFDVYYGMVCRIRKDIKDVRKSFQVSFGDLLFSNHGTFVPHPCMFVSKNVILSSQGLYNLNYLYASDYEYSLRLLHSGVKFRYMPVITTCFREHPESITSSGKLDKERLKILIKYGLFNHCLIKRKLNFFLVWVKYKVKNMT